MRPLIGGLGCGPRTCEKEPPQDAGACRFSRRVLEEAPPMIRSTLARGVRERVVNQLREDILSRRLAEGERLSEMELAKRFGVSRGPIREAFVQLTHEG